MSCSMIFNSYFCNHDYAEINNQTPMLRPKSQNLKLRERQISIFAKAIELEQKVKSFQAWKMGTN